MNYRESIIAAWVVLYGAILIYAIIRRGRH